MSVETFDLSNSISVTPEAAAHFMHQLSEKTADAVRISLKESGCTGLMYVLDEVNAPEPGDITKVLENGVQLYISPDHLSALTGTEVDIVVQGLNKNLVFNNPNVKDACGCGESFSV